MKLATMTALAALLLGAPAASAADIFNGPDQGSYKDGPGEYQGHPAFLGLGVSAFAGGQFTNIDIADEFDGIGADGVIGGLGVEYLFAAGRFRFGPYIEGGWSNINTSIGDFDLLEQEYFFGGGLKAGVTVFRSSLIYGRVGYERASWDIAEGEADADVDSLVVGGGIETLIADNWSLGLGADYVVPMNIEADGQDVTDLLEDTESLRVLGRLTWRR
jgi:opacity protein-like surface antigen